MGPAWRSGPLWRGALVCPGAGVYSQQATSGGCASSIRGSYAPHGSKRYGQRGAKLQPLGMLKGFGTVPLITLSRLPRMPFDGMEVSRPSV